ncbi:MAG: UbiA family prenyltransferase [Fimbriimonas ginsengisoli]|uniref:4-hydroxybenzoate polyprenyltransferase n=1 Tax=Fimbriimonas ginsengisoli TaxID=1005039 RepID=A0A931LVS2_FIMGI|nr:UbiA family prenyltransferase [Fimbriimonas ginsengisoli]
MGAVRVYLEMIKFEHSVFALPFAMIGMMWGAGGWPGWRVFGWIVLAMVSCRSAAMAFNRIADRRIDAANPRTAARALPVGALGLGQTYLFLGVSVALFLASAAMLNPLALALSPVALLVILGYSTTKRFTSLSHFVLGLSLGIAPAAAWIGATGRLDAAILPLVGAVMLWTGGFDILYSLQDDDFDREQGLRSLPVWLGRPKALVVSRLCHAGSVGLLVWGGSLVGAGPIYFAGVLLAGVLLAYEQSLVKPNDLSRVDLAFFTLNGFVSIALFAFALADHLLRHRR